MQIPFQLSMNENHIINTFEVIAKNVKIAQYKWLPGGHFEFDISKNIAIGIGIPPNPIHCA